MRKWLASGLVVASFGSGGSASAKTANRGVQVIVHAAQKRVDVTINGEAFTSYLWPVSLKKPVLYPLITDEGITVTRAYPLESRPGERVDHPHHAGMWFNYGNVNGFDFWNNSDAIKPESRPKMGTIYEEKIVSTKSGTDRGELVVECAWVTGEGKKILAQTTKFVFSRRNGARTVDQIIQLHALDKAVFNDDKEGLLGMRVAHWLESADERGGTFMDADGRPTKVEAADSAGSTGVYRTSEGVSGGHVWGTRGRWCTLTGHTGDHTVAIAMIDHPANPGYPTYWHARGYGLFAANPLGRSIFNPKQPPLQFTIEKGDTATFRYRVVLFSHAAETQEIDREADVFAADYK